MKMTSDKEPSQLPPSEVDFHLENENKNKLQGRGKSEKSCAEGKKMKKRLFKTKERNKYSSECCLRRKKKRVRKRKESPPGTLRTSSNQKRRKKKKNIFLQKVAPSNEM
jgi:hypothetical protein